MLERDVENLTAYFGRYAPALLSTDYGKEIWSIFETGELTPATALTGRFARSEVLADVGDVMEEINAAREAEMLRRRYAIDA